MTACVVDASVAVKWLLPAAGEDLIVQANRLLALHVKHTLHLIAPDLILSEIGNVLVKAVRRGRISQADAEHSLRRFSDLDLEIVPADTLLVKALQIAAIGNRSFYHSLYVALALDAKIELITADERLVNALGSRFPIRWLGVF